MLKEQSAAPQAADSKPNYIPKPDSETRPFVSLIAVASVLVLIVEFIIARSVPFDVLILTSQWAAIGFMHGAAGATIFLTAAISLYLGYRLLTGGLTSLRDLRIMASATAFNSLVTIVLGNWIYIGYRAPGMVQDHFLETQPVLHTLFFEFKENIALFTFPLVFAATFLLFRYGDHLLHRPWLRTIVFMLLAFVFIFFVITFSLGALITKIKPV